jgi:hypothetical protein
VRQPHQIGGILATRRARWWTLARSSAALMGVFGLLLQCLILAVHVPPADAAQLLSPFNDPGAWCGAIADAGGASLPDGTGPKTPLHHPVVCPICVSLQAAGPGLLPVLAMLVVPASVDVPTPVVIHTVRPAPFQGFAGHPRAPPVRL